MTTRKENLRKLKPRGDERGRERFTENQENPRKGKKKSTATISPEMDGGKENRGG